MSLVMGARRVVIALVFVVLVGLAVGLIGWIDVRQRVGELDRRLVAVEHELARPRLVAWDESIDEALVPSAETARGWLNQVGNAHLAHTGDMSLLDTIARAERIEQTDLQEVDAYRLLDWLYVRTIVDEERCLRRFFELIRFAVAVRMVGIEVLYWEVSERMQQCADGTSEADRRHMADLLVELARWEHHDIHVDVARRARDGIERFESEARPWSALDSEREAEAQRLEAELQQLERWLRAAPDDSRFVTHADALRGERAWPELPVRSARFLRLDVPLPHARIAAEAAALAEELLLRALEESE